jgi:hypothetical protein
MQTTPAKRGAPEGTDFSGAIRVNEFGNYAKAHIKMRCVDKGDNARMLAWCDIGATPESIGMSGAVGQSGVAAVGKASQKEAPVVWGDRGLGWEIDAGVRSQPYMITMSRGFEFLVQEGRNGCPGFRLPRDRQKRLYRPRDRSEHLFLHTEKPALPYALLGVRRTTSAFRGGLLAC